MKSIEINPDVMCGQPCLKGRRLTVEHLVGNILINGLTVAEYCIDYQVKKELVEAVLREITDNIGDWINAANEHEGNVKNK